LILRFSLPFIILSFNMALANQGMEGFPLLPSIFINLCCFSSCTLHFVECNLNPNRRGWVRSLWGDLFRYLFNPFFPKFFGNWRNYSTIILGGGKVLIWPQLFFNPLENSHWKLGPVGRFLGKPRKLFWLGNFPSNPWLGIIGQG